MRRLQEKYGTDKLQVLLLSVSLGYGVREENEVKRQEQKVLGQQGVAWTNIMLPNGMQDTGRMFNLHGYGLSLIDPDGIVRGIDIVPEQVEELLQKIYKQ